MEISSPGGLPLGVLPSNILHKRVRRNPNFMQIFQALGLMEGEGSGYDKIYELLSKEGKRFPEIESQYNETKVTIYSQIIDMRIIRLMDYVMNNYKFNTRELTTLGIIAREQKILSTQLSKLLQLTTEERLRDWIGNLIKEQIINSRGTKKATEYLLNPALLSAVRLNNSPTLKTVSTDILAHLVIKDLENHPDSSIREIYTRLKDYDVLSKDVQKSVYQLYKQGAIDKKAPSKTKTVYFLAKKK